MPASDDFGAEQVVHVERADQPVALVDHQQLVDLVPLHQLHGLDRQRLGANGFGPGRHEAVDAMAWKSAPFSSERRRSPSVKMPRTRPASSTTAVIPMRLRDISTTACMAGTPFLTHGMSLPRRMTSATCTSAWRGSLPRGWLRAKSSAEKPRALRSATASASPSARAAVVLAVGARLWGQASCSTAASRSTSASRASAESARPVMAINFAPRRFTSGTISSSSSLDPEYEMATNTSPLSIIPRSPWLASAGCTKRSEEHTPELQSHSELVCRHTPEKKH